LRFDGKHQADGSAAEGGCSKDDCDKLKESMDIEVMLALNKMRTVEEFLPALMVEHAKL
jgi:hypothetical protein